MGLEIPRIYKKKLLKLLNIMRKWKLTDIIDTCNMMSLNHTIIIINPHKQQ